MVDILHFSDSGRMGCGATVRFATGEPCTVSFAQSGVLVKRSRLGFFGTVLYRNKDIYDVSVRAIALAYLFPEPITPAGITSPLLRAYLNAILNCSGAAQVSVVLNEALSRAEYKAGCSVREIRSNDLPSWALDPRLRS